jgi:hypothetical protein
LLVTPEPMIPPFISKAKEIGNNSSGDNDGTAPCSAHNHGIGNNSMTYVEWDPKCKHANHSLIPPETMTAPVHLVHCTITS